MGKKHHRVPADVKADIIKRVKEQGISVAEAAKDAGIHETTIYGWLGSGVKAAPTWGEFNKLKKERDDLVRLVGDLTVKLSNAQKKNW